MLWPIMGLQRLHQQVFYKLLLAYVHHKFHVIESTVAVKLDYHAHLSATVRQN